MWLLLLIALYRFKTLYYTVTCAQKNSVPRLVLLSRTSATAQKPLKLMSCSLFWLYTECRVQERVLYTMWIFAECRVGEIAKCL